MLRIALFCTLMVVQPLKVKADCRNQESFNEFEIQRINYKQTLKTLEDFYKQLTDWERETIGAALRGARSKSFSGQDVLENRELRHFKFDPLNWNRALQIYEVELIQLSINKYYSQKKYSPQVLPKKMIDPENFYSSLAVGQNFLSAKYPVEAHGIKGTYMLNRAKESELLYYTINFDAQTDKLIETFFVSHIHSENLEDQLKGLQWFDHILFFQSLEDYLTYKYELECLP